MNKKIQVAIIGADTFLGREISIRLSKNDKLEIILFDNDAEKLYWLAKKCKNDPQYFFINDYLGNGLEFDFTINCKEILESEIDEKNHESRMTAIEINGLLPYKILNRVGAGQLINVNTDLLYAARINDDNFRHYNERSILDPEGFYGLTKSLALIDNENVTNLVTSIIGRDYNYGNGIEALEYANIIENIIVHNLHLQIPSILHIIPENKVATSEMLLSTLYESSNQLIRKSQLLPIKIGSL